MITRIRAIGIGLGNPEHLTGQAIRALQTVDVILVPDDGEATEATADLAAARQAICAAFIAADHPYRIVEVPEVVGLGREAGAAPGTAAYGHGGDECAEVVDRYAEVIDGLGAHEQTVGLLDWGDPARHDWAVRVVAALSARLGVEHDVIPGISAPQLLAAAHRIPLGRIGSSIHLTTGQRLVAEYDSALGDVVVVLDEDLHCGDLADLYPNVELCWGAFLGSADEVLVRGRLADVIDEVRRVRAEARRRHGWVIDAYLLRPPGDERGPALPAWPRMESLSDGVVSLRPITAADWAVLLEEHNDEESLRWDFTGEPLTERHARRNAARAPRDWSGGRAARCVIVDEASRAAAGTISAVRMGPPDVALIGYGVLPAFRGRGLATRALTLLADWVMRETPIGRLELGHKIDNVVSGKVATGAGFLAEGVHAGRLRNADGTFSDEVSYARIRASAPGPAAST
ncbi:MAG: precorrin-6A synthase (deacetylating) [Micrococcales bacterium]|nr:precorrin-6A synthase (deacetylating) [Micrococcales bacterium]